MAIKTNNFDVLLHFTFQILCFIIFSMIVTIFFLLFLFNFLDAYALQRFHNKCFVIYMFERLCGAIQRMFEFRNRIKIHVNQRNFAMSIEIFHIRWWPMLWWHCCCNFAVAGSMSIQLIHKAYFVCDSFIFFSYSVVLLLLVIEVRNAVIRFGKRVDHIMENDMYTNGHMSIDIAICLYGTPVGFVKITPVYTVVVDLRYGFLCQTHHWQCGCRQNHSRALHCIKTVCPWARIEDDERSESATEAREKRYMRRWTRERTMRKNGVKSQVQHIEFG